MDTITQEQTYIIYIPRKERRKGLMQIERAYVAEVIKLMEYAESEEGHTITQTGHWFKQLRILGTLFKVKQR
jgi:hypothetical protein